MKTLLLLVMLNGREIKVSVLICGMKWEDFNVLFTPRERLEILHNKLMLEGFNV